MSQSNEQSNPCLKEHNLSLNCLNKNNFDREKCEVFFVNYNNCKEFWNKVKASRRAEGKYPYLPADLDQRAQIKAEYMKTKPPQEE